MKISDKLCENCFGISKKRLNWNGKELCDECYAQEVKKMLDEISVTKKALAEQVTALEEATGRQIWFGIDDDTDIHVQRGLDLIARALNKKPYTEFNYVGAPTEAVNGDGVRFSFTDWGKMKDVD